MSNLQPVAITDKNGKRTTVHKNVTKKNKDARINSVSSPVAQSDHQFRSGVGNSFYDDDPNNTHYDFVKVLHAHIPNVNQLIRIEAVSEDPEYLPNLLRGYGNAIILWDEISQESMSLAEAKDKTIKALKRIMKNEDSIPAVVAYSTVLRNINDNLHPVADGEEYIPRRGRTDISEAEKTQIASLWNVGGIAYAYLGITLGGDDEPVEFSGRDILNTMDVVLIARNKETDNDDKLAETFREFISDFPGDMNAPEFLNTTFTANRSDVKDLLVEVAVLEIE